MQQQPGRPGTRPHLVGVQRLPAPHCLCLVDQIASSWLQACDMCLQTWWCPLWAWPLTTTAQSRPAAPRATAAKRSRRPAPAPPPARAPARRRPSTSCPCHSRCARPPATAQRLLPAPPPARMQHPAPPPKQTLPVLACRRSACTAPQFQMRRPLGPANLQELPLHQLHQHLPRLLPPLRCKGCPKQQLWTQAVKQRLHLELSRLLRATPPRQHRPSPAQLPVTVMWRTAPQMGLGSSQSRQRRPTQPTATHSSCHIPRQSHPQLQRVQSRRFRDAVLRSAARPLPDLLQSKQAPLLHRQRLLEPHLQHRLAASQRHKQLTMPVQRPQQQQTAPAALSATPLLRRQPRQVSSVLPRLLRPHSQQHSV